MGCYVHSCLVLNYEAVYWPFSIACPETRTWTIVEECQIQLDQSRYSELAHNGEGNPLITPRGDEVRIELLFSEKLGFLMIEGRCTVDSAKESVLSRTLEA
ncbi:Arginyl-tRNA--protein transferase 1 [Taenia solium]